MATSVVQPIGKQNIIQHRASARELLVTRVLFDMLAGAPWIVALVFQGDVIQALGRTRGCQIHSVVSEEDCQNV